MHELIALWSQFGKDYYLVIEDFSFVRIGQLPLRALFRDLAFLLPSVSFFQRREQTKPFFPQIYTCAKQMLNKN